MDRIVVENRAIVNQICFNAESKFYVKALVNTPTANSGTEQSRVDFGKVIPIILRK